MGPKVLLSFLGTNKYVRCSYYFDGDRSNPVKNVEFLQEALIRYLCAEWDSSDRIVIFVTEEAEKRNWNENGHTEDNSEHTSDQLDNNASHGLKYYIDQLGLSARISDVRVPAGNSEDEMWKIFNIVYEQINDGDEVYLDITHGFRSLPMLAVVLLDYLKVVRKTSVGGIFYGAFESMGPAYKVKGLPLQERLAPVLDLTSFHTLQKWVRGADNFLRFGLTDTISTAIKEGVSVKMRNETSTPEEKQRAIVENRFAKHLDRIYPIFSTARGKQIQDGKVFANVQKDIETLAESGIEFQALTPLLKQMSAKIEAFKENEVMNGFHAAEWCSKHGMVQQGITILLEAITTYTLIDMKCDDYVDHDNREMCSRSMNEISMHERGTSGEAEDNEVPAVKTNARMLQYFSEHRDIANAFAHLVEKRNDINHAGMRKDASTPQRLEKALGKHLDLVLSIIKMRDSRN